MRSLTPIQISTATVLLILAGCTIATSPRVTQRPETKVEKPVVDSSRAVDVNATPYAPGQLQYRLQTSSVVRVIAGDSVDRADSTLLTGVLTLVLVAGPARNSVIADVRSDSVSVATGSGTSAPLPPRDVSAFAIDIQTGRVAPMNQKVRRECAADSADSSPIYGYEVLPSIHAWPVQTWTDTLYTSTCRGGAFLTIARIASYKRLESADSVLRVLRLTQFQISGSGRQWDQKVEVSGEGTSTDTLHLRGSPLRLQAVSGGSQTKLSFRTQLRAQEFTQTSTTHITLRNH